MKLLGEIVNVYLAFKGPAKHFSDVPAPFDIPTAIWGDFNFPHPWSTLAVVCLYHCSQSDGYEILSYYGFDF